MLILQCLGIAHQFQIGVGVRWEGRSFSTVSSLDFSGTMNHLHNISLRNCLI